MNNLDENKKLFLAYLSQIYDQANEHLREQEHKRDQVITFYAVLISFFISTSSGIQKNFGGNYSLLFVDVGLFLIGWLCTKTVADLRGWHKQYLDVIFVLNYIMVRQEDYCCVQDLKNEIQAKIVEDQTQHADNKNKKHQLKISTEDGMFFGVLTFTLAPLLMISHSLFELLYIKHLLWFVISLLIILVIGGYYIYRMGRYMRVRTSNANTCKTWMLDFDYYSN